MQNARLGQFHASRVARVVVVVAGEMQRAMHDQMREVVRRATPLGRGLASDDAKREQHLWRRSAVSQHIGGLVLSPVARVQAANRPVGRQNHGAACTRRPRRAYCHRFSMRDQPTPCRLGHNDVDLASEPRLRGATTSSGVHRLFASPVSLAAPARFTSLVAFRRSTLIIRVYDACNQRMPNHIACAHPRDTYASNAFQCVQRVAQT